MLSERKPKTPEILVSYLMIFRPMAPPDNITYSVFIIHNHRRSFLANCGQTETKPK